MGCGVSKGNNVRFRCLCTMLEKAKKNFVINATFMTFLFFPSDHLFVHF